MNSKSTFKKIVLLSAVTFYTALSWSAITPLGGFKNDSVSKNLSQRLKSGKPYCKELHGACGFNYSTSYSKQGYNKPWGGYLKCKITYWKEGAIDKSSEVIYYTNCGTCKEAALRDGRPGFTTVESPTSEAIYQAKGGDKICELDQIKHNNYDKNGWSFMVEPVDSDSTCRDFREIYSFPSKKSPKGQGNDACIDYN